LFPCYREIGNAPVQNKRKPGFDGMLRDSSIAMCTECVVV
jgi:hypothetical protein